MQCKWIIYWWQGGLFINPEESEEERYQFRSVCLAHLIHIFPDTSCYQKSPHDNYTIDYVGMIEGENKTKALAGWLRLT